MGITFLRSCDGTEALLSDIPELVVCRDRIRIEESLTVDAFCSKGAWCNYEYLDRERG